MSPQRRKPTRIVDLDYYRRHGRIQRPKRKLTPRVSWRERAKRRGILPFHAGRVISYQRKGNAGLKRG